MSKREVGYYFVLLNGVCEIAKYINHLDGFLWQMAGIENDYKDSDFDSIDERKIERKGIKGEDEKWHDVPHSHSGWIPN